MFKKYIATKGEVNEAKQLAENAVSTAQSTLSTANAARTMAIESGIKVDELESTVKTHDSVISKTMTTANNAMPKANFSFDSETATLTITL